MTNVGDLIRRVQAGDLQSYEEVVERFRAWAFSRAFARLGDSQLAEDAVQEAFVEAYRNLGSLAAPEAFPSWFRKVLVTACNRMTRRRTVVTIPLTGTEETIQGGTSLSSNLERMERDRMVHRAIQSLPDSQRTVTALYFIGGMTQREIGDYLGLSEAAVKKRLFSARRKLKEYVINMAKTISDEAISADGVSARVIAELVSRPQPLLIEGHPIRSIVDDIKAALPEYEIIESSEIEPREIYPSIREAYLSEYGGGYCLDPETMLRTHTTGATLRAIQGRKPPVRLITAGRVFRPGEEEDDLHLKVFHQLDLICVESDASIDTLKMTLQRVLGAVLNTVEIRFREAVYRWVDKGMDVAVKVNGEWLGVAGCGMLKPAMLGEAGHDPTKVGGYAFGLGLERLAHLRLGLKSIHELWRPPYVQPA